MAQPSLRGQNSAAGPTVESEKATSTMSPAVESQPGPVTVDNTTVAQHGHIDVNNSQSHTNHAQTTKLAKTTVHAPRTDQTQTTNHAPTINHAQTGDQTINFPCHKLGWKGMAVIIVGVLAIVVLATTLPLVLRNPNSRSGAPSQSDGKPVPASGSSASSATTPATAAAPTVSGNIASSTVAPPQFTADGLYLLNFNASEGPARRGSVFVWFAKMNLDNNAHEPPNDLAVVTEGEYIEWENRTIAGNFTSTGVIFTAHIDLTAADIASRSVNSPVGTAWNMGSNGTAYRSFTVYKGTGQLFWANDSLSYYQNYYAG